MSADLCFEMMNNYSPSIAAAKKAGDLPKDFAFYSFEWLGDKPEEWDVMKVTGSVFRAAKQGKNKGLRAIEEKQTRRIVYVTKKEINEAQP